MVRRRLRQDNPKSYVPALEIEGGYVLTEGAVILAYIADSAPEKRLLSPVGTLERLREIEWLAFISTELHKNFITPERHGGVAANLLSKTAVGQHATQVHVGPRLTYVDRQLADRKVVMGDVFTAPDAYLFVMWTWARRLGFDLEMWPNLLAFAGRMEERASVRRTIEIEGPPHSLVPAQKNASS